MLSKPTILLIVAIMFGTVFGSRVCAQGVPHIPKSAAAPSTPNLPNSRYVAIVPPAENYAASCIWVLDTFTGQMQAYRILFQAIGGTSYSYFVRLPEFQEGLPPGQSPVNP